MPGFGIGMINDDFHIAGVRQVVAERFKRAVMYSMALGPRCFKWKMLSLSGPKALLFLQLLIAYITRSVVECTASSWSLWRPVGMWCVAALSRTVRKIFSSLWQSVGRERLLRAASTSYLYLSQLDFFRLT